MSIRKSVQMLGLAAGVMVMAAFGPPEEQKDTGADAKAAFEQAFTRVK